MKQVIVVRMDLNMPKGKLAAQVAHASVDCVLKTDKKTVDEWKREGGMKVVLKGKDLKHLEELRRKAARLKLRSSLVRDAGHTVLKPGTTTCLGIGPDSEDKIDRVTGDLETL